jgi:hypothetical protein
MMDLDLAQLTREAEQMAARLDDMRRDLEAFRAELVRAAEEKAEEAVASLVAEPQRPAALRLARRGIRVADEVSAWVVGRTAVGLAQRLLPEVRLALADVQELLQPLPVSRSGPAPASPAP